MSSMLILKILLAFTVISCEANTPPIVRVDPRSWQLPIDRPVGSPTARITVKDVDSTIDTVNITIQPVTLKIGGFLDGSEFFDIRELPRRESSTRRFETILNKPLSGAFQVGDQFNLYIKAYDGQLTFTNEIYGEVEHAANPNPDPTDDLTTTSITRLASTASTTSSTSTSSSTSSSSLSSSTYVAPTPGPHQAGQGQVAEQAAGSGEAEEGPDNSGGMTFIIVIVPLIIILPSIAVGGYFCRGRLKTAARSCCKKENKDDLHSDRIPRERKISTVLSTHTELTEVTSRKTSLGVSNSYVSEISRNNTKDFSLDDPWEFPRHHLKIFGILGEGCFGQVWKAEAVNLKEDEASTTVAVKTLKEVATDKEKKDLLQELAVMKMLEEHPNVVTLLGCCTEKDPIFVIMEFVSKGKLQDVLRSSREDKTIYYGNLHGTSQRLTSHDLTQFCHQIAKGMDYLASKKVIHRDLAARNVLVTEDNVCKIADFGFSRDVMINNIYERKSEGRLPIRWMAPESLYDNIYTTKTDVWSFGILMWEIVTLGSTPYPGMSGSEVMKRVRENYRLEKPEHCDREMYNIMYYCWDRDPAERPSFSQLVKDFENMLMKDTNYIDLNQFPDHLYYNEVSLSGERV